MPWRGGTSRGMKGCSVCGSPEEHFDGAQCVDHLMARLAEAEKLVKELQSEVECEERRFCDQYDILVEVVSRADDAESHLRDAEARAGSLEQTLRVIAGDTIGYGHLGYGEPTASALAAKAALDRLTTGAFDRIRNEALEEAAKIIMEQYTIEKDGLNNCHALDALYHAREAIRAAKNN